MSPLRIIPERQEGLPGSCTIRTAPRITPDRNRLSLRLTRGTGPRTEIISTLDRVIVGRCPKSDLVIDSSSVSLVHCEIVSGSSGYVLRDLDSDTGTWLGEIRVRDVYLPPVARIGVGEAEVNFRDLSHGEGELAGGDRGFGRMIGESDVMRATFARLSRIAGRNTTLLLEGESGTGKELAAGVVNDASSRSGGPFVVIACGSVPSPGLEAELFGLEPGVYSRGLEPREGAFARASGGTLFLDEIDQLDLDLQPRLLRILEHREVTPIGGSEAIPVDVRIIAATSCDLREKVARGEFREDLYYRLAVACVRLPSLRERPEDIPLLVKHFLEQQSQQDGVPYSLDDQVLGRLVKRPWPGNVRELRNAVEQIVAFGTDEAGPLGATDSPPRKDAPFKLAKAQLLERFEYEYLVSILGQHGGNITAAASAADLDRVHFLRLLDRHGLRKTRVT